MTGGSGFIGHQVVRLLLEQGLEVSCLLLPDDGALLLNGLPITRYRGDLGEERELATLMEGHDVVFHLAAIYALWMKRPARMWEVNLEGTAQRASGASSTPALSLRSAAERAPTRATRRPPSTTGRTLTTTCCPNS